MAMVDVTVRGAGIFGLSIAWTCARRGAKVQVVDPFGAGSGSSNGLVGALAPHVPENWNAKKAFQFDSLIMAEPFWKQVEATGASHPDMRVWAGCSPLLTPARWSLPIPARSLPPNFGRAAPNGGWSRPKRSVHGARPVPPDS